MTREVDMSPLKLEITPGLPMYKLTGCGRAYIDYILTLPFPRVAYDIQGQIIYKDSPNG